MLATLQRRMAFGFRPGEWDAAVARGASATVDALLAPDAASIAAPADPWDDARIGDGSAPRTAIVYLVDAWLTRMVTTPRPLVEWMAWFWHGHFVSAFPKVKEPLYAVTQLRLFQQSGLGSFPSLLRAVTIDPAMLVYLDGRQSSGQAPNENFARELMELFTLGVGNYTEDDVQAAARALTGWVVRTPKDGPADRAAQFVARRHDDAPQHFLDRDGVHDLDTVVAALCAQRRAQRSSPASWRAPCSGRTWTSRRSPPWRRRSPPADSTSRPSPVPSSPRSLPASTADPSCSLPSRGS